MAKSNPCWDGYVQVGFKSQGGKKVPNCVPEGKGKDKVPAPKKKGKKQCALLVDVPVQKLRL